MPPALFLFLKAVLASQDLLYFQTNFRILSLISVKNAIVFLIGITESVDSFKVIWSFNCIILPIHCPGSFSTYSCFL